MEVSISNEGMAAPSRHWVICPGGSTVTFDVRWTPGPDTKGRSKEPQCRLTYLTAPGLVPGGLPGEIMMRPNTDENEGYHGSRSIQVPRFHPLRVRLELRPYQGVPHSHIAFVIPNSSARVSTGLVVSSIIMVAVVAIRTLVSLEVTAAQGIAGVSAVALVLFALWILRSALKALRSDDLPFFGVTYVIYRSLGACLLGFAVLIGLIQQFVVSIHNHTEDEVEFDFSWLEQPEVVPAGTTISLVPPNRDALVDGLLDALAENEQDRALCVVDARGSKHACRPRDEDIVDDWYLHPFTPKTLEIGCGRRWGDGLRASDVFQDGHKGILIADDDVWLEPGPDSHCGRDERATLWFRDREGDAAHYVRYPFSPRDVDDLGVLWTAIANENPTRMAELVLRSVRSASDDEEDPFLPETRLRLSGSEAQRHAWPLMSLPTGSEPEIYVEISESLQKLTDTFSAAATLKCKRGRGRGGLQAIRLGYDGPAGWLARLDVQAGRGLSWDSSWQLQGTSSANVVVPWICEAFTGDDPRVVSRQSFSSDSMAMHLGGAARSGSPRLVIPAFLAAARIEVYHFSEAAVQAEENRVGTIECNIDVRSDESIIVGRVTVDGKRRGLGGAVQFESEGRTLGRWSPAEHHRESYGIWSCWPHEPKDDELRVTLEITDLDDSSVSEASGRWSLGDADLKLDQPTETVCYIDAKNEIVRREQQLPRTRLGGARDLPKSERESIERIHPEMQSCRRIVRVERGKRGKK